MQHPEVQIFHLHCSVAVQKLNILELFRLKDSHFLKKKKRDQIFLIYVFLEKYVRFDALKKFVHPRGRTTALLKSGKAW